ncbi:MAG: hypothetical protein EP329_02555 [Deltaproteobacteria bacterium]|nr:MAG: hypothetical protein EP329_02555 [Deltaproteobacteria bacterium]
MLIPRLRILAALGVASLVLVAPARGAAPADGGPAVSEASDHLDRAEAPWQTGVSEERRDTAQALFAEANERFGDKEYPRALELYREARAAWDHPSINYNMAVCLLELDQGVAAWEALERSLRYGQGPLSDRNYVEAQRYQRLLKGSLGFVRVRVAESHARVTLDGRELLVGPGEATRVLAPGPHELVASKTGFVTLTRPTVVPAGEETVVELALEPLTEVAQVRRWPTWMPWVVVGGGVLIAASGAPLLASARDDYDAYDAYVSANCGGGCAPSDLPRAVRDDADRGDAKRAGAITLFSLGAAAAITGAVLVVMNQPTEVRRPVSTPTPLLTVAPILGDGGAMVTGTVRF